MTTKRFEYQLWDVFASRPLAGNALAVLPDARGLDQPTMQALAREFNLSETAFVLPSERADVRARYFTPTHELPMAGHPTVGTAFALAQRGTLPGDEARIELGVGVVPLKLERDGETLVRVWMDQGVPRLLAAVAARDGVAGALGLDAGELHPGLPLEVVSAGVPFLLVPVRDRDALGRLRLDPTAMAPHLPAYPLGVLAFTLDSDDSLVRARMFGEAFGVVEDPGTGAAHGPLGGYLASHGVLAPGIEPATFLSRQGVEMKRPSEIDVRVRLEGDEPAVEVGGAAVRVATGWIDL